MSKNKKNDKIVPLVVGIVALVIAGGTGFGIGHSIGFNAGKVKAEEDMAKAELDKQQSLVGIWRTTSSNGRVYLFELKEDGTVISETTKSYGYSGEIKGYTRTKVVQEWVRNDDSVILKSPRLIYICGESKTLQKPSGTGHYDAKSDSFIPDKTENIQCDERNEYAVPMDYISEKEYKVLNAGLMDASGDIYYKVN